MAEVSGQESHVQAHAGGGGLGDLSWAHGSAADPGLEPSCPRCHPFVVKAKGTESPCKAPRFLGTGGATVAWAVICSCV